MNAREEYDQDFIIDIMNAISTSDSQVSESGVCAGIGMLAVQAFLAGEIHAFSQRMDKLYRLWMAFGGNSYLGFDKDAFKEKIEALQKQLADESKKTRKIKNVNTKNVVDDLESIDFEFDYYEIPSDIDNQDIIDMLATHNIIYLYQYPERCLEIFGEKLTQNNLQKISTIAGSLKLDKIAKAHQSIHQDKAVAEADVLIPDSWSGMYTQDELFKYCSSLTQAAQKNNEAFSVVLESIVHRIVICYENGAWLFINPSSLPVKTITSANELALEINNALVDIDLHRRLGKDNSVTGFSTTICTTPDKKPAIESMLKDLKSSPSYLETHTITRHKAQLENWYRSGKGEIKKNTLLRMAAINGHTDTVDNILSELKLIPEADLLFASTACHGDSKMLHLFSSFADKVDEETFYELARIAAQYGNTSVLSEMLMKNEKRFDEFSWMIASTAIDHQQEKVIQFLTSKKKLVFDHGGGLTLALHAVKKGDIDMLAVLDRATNFLKSDRYFWDTALWAAKEKQFAVLDFLGNYRPQVLDYKKVSPEEIKSFLKALRAKEKTNEKTEETSSPSIDPLAEKNKIINLVNQANMTKEKLFKVIQDSPLSAIAKIHLYQEILDDKDSILGKFFRVKRGGFFSPPARLGKGMLKIIQEEKESLEKLMHHTPETKIKSTN